MYSLSSRSDGIDTLNFATLYSVVGVDNCNLDSVAESRRLSLPRLHLPLKIGEPVLRVLIDRRLRARHLLSLTLRLRKPPEGGTKIPLAMSARAIERAAFASIKVSKRPRRYLLPDS